MIEQKVWFITGTSSGLGKCLVSSALQRGDYVIATGRHMQDFSADRTNPRLHVMELDVTESEETIKRNMNNALAVWGRIDILVNNAGYGSKCMIEEGGSTAALAQFQTNFFGVLNVTNAILPHMRSRKAGTVVLVGSRSIWQANVPTAGFYIASKAAIHAISETLSAELAPFGIRVLLVAPGGFRTNSNDKIPYSMNHHVEDYDGFRESILEKLKDYWKHVKGDPAKAMEVLVDVLRGEGRAEGRGLPSHLLLGNPTYDNAKAYSERLSQTMKAWEDIAMDLDFEDE
ncbi:NAD-P-binding protein [Laetiporus sulphureus 93-53]|uniref:NAD-P-binding protein n=1 Tax=Laetiporus sulphureus 93-53 TaxID=1314785 RepID=A0A165DWB2_9APHY|nr:NAD-P-binding protein [Laetiporus sulphureus 93-53]KZT05762.1 NAD-P-binding protein [Laetiporus sulphureus 93-53]